MRFADVSSFVVPLGYVARLQQSRACTLRVVAVQIQLRQAEQDITLADLDSGVFADAKRPVQVLASLLEIADTLGHRTMQMVKRYAHLAQSHKVDVIERMAKAKGL